MRFSEAVKRVEESPAFTGEPGYLVHGFSTHDGEAWSAWQVGYYDAAEGTITAYTVGEEVEGSAPAEVFTDQDTVLPLHLEKVRLSRDEAVQRAHRLLSTKYAGHSATKTLVLLQHIPAGHVFNITVVTDSLHMLNLKLDSDTGQVLAEEFASILSLSKT